MLHSITERKILLRADEVEIRPLHAHRRERHPGAGWAECPGLSHARPHPGSCCYLIDGRYLATGDSLAYRSGRFEPFVDFFNMDTRWQEEAVKVLPDLKSVRYILTAHHGVIQN